MRKIKKVLCVILSLISIFSLTACGGLKNYQRSDRLRILTLGNSFSVDGMNYIYQIATDLGIEEITLGNLFISGCKLNQHLENAREDNNAYTYYTCSNVGKGTWFNKENVSISTALLDKEWDFIIFQQGVSQAGIPETYDDLQPLAEIVRNACPNAIFGWQMTWADQEGSTREDFADFNYDQQAMYLKIASAVKEKIINNELISSLIPTGTAIQNMRGTSYGDKLTRDGYHLSLGMGRYIAGLTWVYSLTGLDISNVNFAPSGVTKAQKDLAIKCVKEAYKNPVKVSKIK